MTPRPWVKRECSAVGKTHRALCSWLIRRRRWSHAVSSRSSSATSSSGSPAAADGGRRQPLGEVDIPVDRVADEVDGGERLPPHGWVATGPRSRLAAPCAHIATPVGGSHAYGVRPAAGSVRQRDRRRRRVVAQQRPSCRSRSGSARRSRAGRRYASGGRGRSRSTSSARRRRSGWPGSRAPRPACGRSSRRRPRTRRSAVRGAIRQPDTDVIELVAQDHRPMRGAVHPQAL